MALHDRRIRVLVTAGSAVAVSQLARDLAGDRSLGISIATNVESLWLEVDAVRPMALLLDTRIAGSKTPELVGELIRRAKLPILIRSESNDVSAGILLDCIEAGALGILNKPTTADAVAREMPGLIWSLKAAAGAAMSNLPSIASNQNIAKASGGDQSIVAIGAGLGGTIQLTNLLARLPADAPASVVIAPLPSQLLGPWAERLSGRCQVAVKQARDGDLMKSGQVLIAPGNGHLLIRRSGSDWAVRIKDGPAVFQNRPSVEILFNSIADSGAPKAVGVLLSSAGVDGIAGLLQLRKSGGRTITESPATSIFPELPTRALKCGAAEASPSRDELVDTMIEFARQQPKSGVAA